MTGLPAELLRAAGIESFEQPAWLLLLVPASIALALAARARPPVLEWSGFDRARISGASAWDPIRTLGFVLRGLAVLALVGVLAGPAGVHRAPPEPGYGLDLVLAVDASGSMRAADTEVAGEWRPRLELARQAVGRFARQRAEVGDRVALVVFGESAFTQCPLTSDGRLLASALERVEAGVAGEATALGDALALAVRRALGAGQGGSGAPLAGRLVVMLTDGRSNTGSLSVELATAIAEGEGVRVHTVAVGSQIVEAPPSPGAASRASEHSGVDVDALKGIAAATGGRFFHAQRSGDLREIYREIDTIERVAQPRPPRIRRAPRPEPLLALAGGSLVLELAVCRALRRRLP